MYFQFISDKYKLIDLVAGTDHAQVYLVQHRRLEVLRIAKIVRKECADCERILREANLIKNFKNTGIPLIYDIEEDSDSICIIEEYIAGKSLAEFIPLQKGWDVSRIARMGVRICEILEQLHAEGIYYMDLKPAHVIIQEQGVTERIALIDFDSSIRQDVCPVPVYGTVGFAAPECYAAAAAGGMDPAGGCSADIYSMGMLLLYMANDGHMQSVADGIAQSCRLYSNTIAPVIEKCIRHNPNQRYQSISALKEELLPFTETQPFSGRVAAQGLFYDICVFGTKHGIGTTHLCLCIAAFLHRRKKRAVCIRHGDSRDLIAEVRKGRLDESGVYHLHGIGLLPEYHDFIKSTITSYEYRIHDCGVASRGFLHRDFPDRWASEKAIRLDLLLGDIGYRLEDKRRIEKAKMDMPIFINHIGGKDFYEYVKKEGTHHQYYRFPCMYRWEEANPLFDSAAAEALKPVLTKEGIHRKHLWQRLKQHTTMKGALIETKE